MSTIDDKVVAMSFESSKFEQGVHNTISALDKLKAALHFPGAGKGLDEISASAKRMDLGHIGRSVDEIKNKFTALNVAALAVIANIAQKAVSAGINFAKAFTIDPMKAGFSEYATNLNAVQTILANTQASGAKLADVNKALKELNDYSDKTIYNFSQMARNIGTFTAAGVDLDTATGAIKGIANLAALSGSNADQASTAMYQLSQAISAGSVKLQDWNSVVNAGMGGTVFQRALAQTAVAMGTLDEKAVKLTGKMKNVSIEGEAFRNSLSRPGKDSWLTSDVLTKTLEQFTGDLSKAQLKAQGFNDAQIKAIQQTAKTAMHAATEVKTLSQVLDVAKETAGSGWAQTWQIIFGDFGEAKKTFTDLSNTINGFINANANARNKVLADWKALGGRTVLIEGIKQAFEDLSAVIKPIKDAFRDVFPAITGKNLYDLTVQFKQFMEAIKPSPQTIDLLRSTFRGLFAVLDIGKQIITGILGMFKTMFTAVAGGSGSFLKITAGIGDFLFALDQALKKSGAIQNFFERLGEILAKPIELLGKLAAAFADLFSGFSSGGVSGQINGITKAMTPLQKIMAGLSTVWDNFKKSMSGVADIFGPLIEAIISGIAGLGTALGHAASQMSFEPILQVIRTGLLGGIFLMFKKFLGKGSLLDQLGGAGGGFIKNISGMFDALRGSMEAMQNNIKADTLKKIAVAIGILTASIVALSLVDQTKLMGSLTAIGVAFGELLGAMAILEKITASKGFLKMPFVAAGLIGLAGAIDLLSLAVLAMSRLSWEGLLKGLGGVAGLLATLAVAIKPLSTGSAGLIRAGIGITGIAIAMNLLALAMKQMSGMKWAEMGKGLAGVAGGLAALTAAMRVMPTKGMMAAGIAVIAIATGLNILAKAVASFAGMDVKGMAKGIAGVGASLALVGAAMRLFPTNMLLTAAGLFVVALALQKISGIVQTFAGMSIHDLAKGLVSLGAAMGILAAGLYAMEGGLAGAAALGVAALGLSLLATTMQKLAGMSWQDLLKSLGILAIVIGGVAAAGIALAPATPEILAFGAALLLIGAGLALAGAGIALVGVGLSSIAVAGPTAIGILIAALDDLVEAAIRCAKQFILGLLEIVKMLAQVAPQFVDALVKILNALLDVVIKSSPKIAQAFTALLDAALKVIRDNFPKIVQAGFDLIIQLLKGIEKNLPAIVKMVGDIIVKFINSLSKDYNKIVEAGVNFLVKFIEGVTKQIPKIAEAVTLLITTFIAAVGRMYGDIINAGVNVLIKLIEGIGKNINNIVTAGTKVIISFIEGIGNAAGDIVKAAVTTIITLMNTLSSEGLKLIDAGFKVMINFLNGLANAIDANAGQVRAAGARVGMAIINGMTGGLLGAAGDLYNKISGVMSKAKSLMHLPFKINSPSKVTMQLGSDIIEGLVKGLDDNEKDVYKSATSVSNSVITGFKKTLKVNSPSEVMIEIGKAVGEGFAVGLRGSASDINSAFKDMNDKLMEEMKNARETITSEQDKLAEARKKLKEQQDKLDKEKADKKPDQAAIKSILDDIAESKKTIGEIQAVITENESILAKTTAAHKLMLGTLKDEKNELTKLANEYDTTLDKLEKAQQALDDIKQARADMVSSVTAQYGAQPELDTTTKEDIAAARQDIKDAKKDLTDTQNDNKKAAEDVTKAKLELADAKKDLAKVQADAASEEEDVTKAQDKVSKAQEELNKTLEGQTASQEKVTNAQTGVAKAQDDLKKLLAGKTLDSAGNSVDQLATYEDALKHQTTAIGAYNSTLQQLRKLGLDDATYKKLVDDGVADAAFAKQLLAGGRTAVEKLNKLEANLQRVSTRLGTNVGKNMFKAGQDTAQGIVDGLEDKKSVIYTKMREIGRDMVTELKKELKIKSPSEVFMEIGKWSMEGMAEGFTNSSRVLQEATDKAAQDALTAMQKSMQDIHGAITSELDSTPVITPILDLTTIRSQVRELNALTSYGQATSISAQTAATQADQTTETAGVGPSVIFEQNNYSPEALSSIEIYRQTKNQMAQLKSALSITTP